MTNLNSQNKKRVKSVLGLGIIPFDLLYTVDKYPKANDKIDALDFISQAGGPIPNCMVGLARLGISTSIIAAIGNDLIGQEIIRNLKLEGVNHKHLIIKNRSSAIAAGFIEKGSGRRTIALYRNIDVKPIDIKLSSLSIPDLVHLDGRDMPATMKLARWAKRQGVLISFDVGSPRFEVSEIFPLVDHLVVADTFAFPLTKTKTAKKAIEQLAKLCPGQIVVTEGIKGSTGFNREEFYSQRAYKVKNVDTTGAGDAFHTGYLYGLLKGDSMPDNLRLGSIVAALKCTKLGGQTGLPTISQINNFLRKKPRQYA